MGGPVGNVVGMGGSFSGFGLFEGSDFGVGVGWGGFLVGGIFFTLINGGLILAEFGEVKPAFAELRSVLVLLDEGLGGVYLHSLFICVLQRTPTFLFVLNNLILLPY